MTQYFAFAKRGALFLLVLLLLGGCASKGAIRTTTPLAVKLSNYKTIMVNVSSQGPGLSEEIVQLETMTITKLREKGLFDKVIAGSSSPDAPTDLRLNARIVELKRVSSGARVMVGAFAGRAGIDIDVELTDMRTGKGIGTFMAQGRSSGGTVFAGTTPQAVERAVEQIVEFIQNSM